MRCWLNDNNAKIVCVLPRFERSGWLPPGEHKCEWAEFVERFGGESGNGRRQRLIEGLARLLVILASVGCRTVWIDGSFVSREKWPRDFDLCYDPQDMKAEELPTSLRDLSLGRTAQKQAFGGEALPENFPFDWNGQTVREAFARSRSGEKKGLVRLDLMKERLAIEAFVQEQANGDETDDSKRDSTTATSSV